MAEVAARFTLDALPGKQMSIDADLRAGAIDQAEARRRRRALEREGQLYGAMDGALKFVKGDALAGVAIVLVNVAGGLVAGLVRGLPLEAAARRYALLAIGDGLVAQLPALLISVAAGVAVTRVAAEEEGGSLSSELGRQLFSDPRALAAVAALCLSLAAVPGLPALPFLVLTAASGGAAFLLARRAARPAASEERTGAPDALPGRPLSASRAAATASPLVVELAPDLAGTAVARRLQGELLPALQEELALELGLRIPALGVRAAALPAGGWRLLLDEVPAGGGRAAPSEALALATPGELAAVGLASVAELEPLSGACAARIRAEDAPRAAALAPVRDACERIAAGVAAALRTHAYLLVGVQEVVALLDAVEVGQPALVREVTRQVPAPVLAEVLRQLLEEGVSLRPLRSILEALLDGGGAVRPPALLVERCRRALSRHIAHAHASSGTLEALLLDPAAEATLREALVESVLAVDPATAEALLEQIGAALVDRERGAPVLLAPSEVRRPLRQLIAARFPRIPVLSYEELPPTLAVQPVGRLELAHGEGAPESVAMAAA